METCNGNNHDRHLCKLYSDGVHQNNPDHYARLVRDPEFVCRSCGRVAAKKENLCCPIPLGTWEEP